jgi:hypothetical protein
MELEGISTEDLYKNLFYALNFIIYGVTAWINKIKNDVNSFYGTKKKGGLNANSTKNLLRYVAVSYLQE